MDYRILFMDEDQDRMYVGCKDHALSMDINNISQTLLKVRAVKTSLLDISMKCSTTVVETNDDHFSFLHIWLMGELQFG